LTRHPLLSQDQKYCDRFVEKTDKSG